MSAQQLEVIISDIQACFGAWEPETPMEQMRQDWDDLFSKTPCPVGAAAEKVDAGGVPALKVSAAGAEPDRAILYLHGGGYVFGSPVSHRDLGEFLSKAAKATVFLLDYRLAPEHPFPAAVDDAISAYQWLLDQGFKPGRIAISGDSAGGGLSFATLLSIRDKQLPLPACATPLSPWVDLECSGETMTSKAAVDPIVQRELTRQLSDLYVTDGNLRHPLASPLYADLSGLPPMLIQVGDRETLLDDSRRIAARAKEAGVDVQLEIAEGQIHVYQIFANRLDEAVSAIDRLGQLIQSHTS